MGSILILVFTALMVLVSGFIVLIVLMQRPSANSGMGSALGGGAAESAFGAQTGNILTRATIFGCVAFFILAFSLYLGHMANLNDQEAATDKLAEMLGATTDTEPTDGPIKPTPDQESSLTDLNDRATADAIKAEVEEASKASENKDEPLGLQLNTELDVKSDAAPEKTPAIEVEETESK